MLTAERAVAMLTKTNKKEGFNMEMLANKMFMGIIAIVAGIIVLIWPAIIAWIIGIFLIVNGILLVLGKK